MIERPAIIITSLGRTGTTFFASLFREIVPDCISFHEPDVVQYFGTDDRFRSFLTRVRDAGVYNMVFLKLLGKWSLIKLSDERLRGKLSYEDAAIEVYRQRNKFVSSKPGSIFIESNGGYYGLIDVIKDVYHYHRAIYLVRDGRDWVSSAMRVDELYGKKGVRKIFAHKVPAASQFPSDPLYSDWHSASRFVKYCWAWAKLNEYGLCTVSKNPHARMFKFEDIFFGKEKYEQLNHLVAFATSLPGLESTHIRSTKGWLEKKINQSTTNSYSWKEWSKEERRQFEKVCGPLMKKLGYEF